MRAPTVALSVQVMRPDDIQIISIDHVCVVCVLQSFDRNQDGVLQKLEFEEFMSQLGVFLARQELRVVFDNFDANKDGNIAYNEFVDVLKVSHVPFTSIVHLSKQF